MPKIPSKWLIFSLGNPGEDYENTYHNAGVMALPNFIETLAGEHSENLDWKTHKHLFEYAIFGEFVFAKSLTFMNESGRTVAEAVKKINISSDHLVVLQDDSDITLGDFKLSFDRSSGGHKGAQSIIDHLKTQTFWRARFGVRPLREAKRKKAGDFVLARLTPTATKKLSDAFRKASEEMAKKVLGI